VLVGTAKRTSLAKLLEDEADLRRRQVFLTFPVESFRIVGSRSFSRRRGVFVLVDIRIEGYLFGRCRFQDGGRIVCDFERAMVECFQFRKQVGERVDILVSTSHILLEVRVASRVKTLVCNMCQ
jgi:hypothetical protein